MRLRANGFKTGLVKNQKTDALYVMVVEKSKLTQFVIVFSKEENELMFWLDDLNLSTRNESDL